MGKQENLELYIHIPFCKKKCAYCDFLSAPATEMMQEQYVHCLLAEIKEKAPKYKRFSFVIRNNVTSENYAECINFIKTLYYDKRY